MKVKEVKVIHWVLAVPFALILSLSPASNESEPDSVHAPIQSTNFALLADVRAEADVVAISSIYEQMDSTTHMPAVVYEPVSEGKLDEGK